MELSFWLCLPITLMLSLSALAQDQDPRIHSWKTLTNENGYEFKYPDCWIAQPDNPDELDQPVTKAHDIFIKETPNCATPPLFPPSRAAGLIPNGVGFSAGWIKTPSKEEVEKKIGHLEKFSENNIQRRQWLYFKRFKIGANPAYVDVRFDKDVGYVSIRWEMTLYCPKYEVKFSGPVIMNPAQSYLDKFKAGDVALPEPERTIFESIRCVP